MMHALFCFRHDIEHIVVDASIRADVRRSCANISRIRLKAHIKQILLIVVTAACTRSSGS
jgi:hypothetical protein